MTERVVVTGNDGFVGRHLCAALASAGHHVIGMDLKTGHDIRWCDLPEADTVYHLAAQTDAYCQDAATDCEVNICGSLRIFARYREKVVFASSAMVSYPTTPYAISKRAAEDYARLYGCSIVRFPNIYGPGGHSVIDKFSAAHELTIYGDGSQLRSYADVDEAVTALIERRGFFILAGDEMTVNQIADGFDKPRRYLPARAGDMADARQI